MHLTLRVAICSFLLFAAGLAAQEPAACPWFSLGSAETALGAPVSIKIHVDSASQGTCEFTAQSDNTKSLRIVIGKVDAHDCPQDAMKLKALGNEAVQCRRTGEHNESIEVIAGRVRDVFFAVSIRGLIDAAATPGTPAHPIDPFDAPLLERVAEQVAGNLF
jgi:hypothetical protein